MAIDPVCGMKVDEAKAVARAEHEGKIFYFCSQGCHKAFVQQPAKYMKAAGSSPVRG